MDTMLTILHSGAAASTFIVGSIFFVLAYGIAVLLIRPWLSSGGEESERKFRLGAGVGSALVALSVAAANSPAVGVQGAQVAKVESNLVRPVAYDGIAHPPRIGVMQIR
jgi:hypothetical protein